MFDSVPRGKLRVLDSLIYSSFSLFFLLIWFCICTKYIEGIEYPTDGKIIDIHVHIIDAEVLTDEDGVIVDVDVDIAIACRNRCDV